MQSRQAVEHAPHRGSTWEGWQPQPENKYGTDVALTMFAAPGCHARTSDPLFGRLSGPHCSNCCEPPSNVTGSCQLQVTKTRRH